jgi:pyridoxamine 5'-phosphate oxidase-like protein
VRPDGRPHTTPVAGVWADGSFFFSTGPHERKAQNLAANSHCVVTTGCNDFLDGLDVVVEGNAVGVGVEDKLRKLAGEFATKYSDYFGFQVRDGSFVHGEGGVADVFEIAPVRAFAYGRGEQYTATRFRFDRT